MKSILMVIAMNDFRDEEFLEPKILLEDAMLRVKVASHVAGWAEGKMGLRAVAEWGLDDIDPDEWSAVIFVGGSGASVFFDDPRAHELARTVYKNGGVVSAICIAPSTLARAGLLEGKRATAFESQKEDLLAHGAEFTGAGVEVDGRIVTANGPESATEFGEVVRDLLKGDS